MTRTVLADTGPLYALADPSDQHHKRSASELASLETRGFEIAVSYPVLCEAYTLVLYRLGSTYAREWLAEVLAGSVLVSAEHTDVILAAAQLDRYHDHPITLVDSVLAAISARLQAPIWTFDRHFTIMRTKLWR
jgi:predicted nucleic acid-binding protein